MKQVVASVDEYIDQLDRWKEEISLLRAIVLSCGLEETIKWGGPCYTWQNKNVAGLAAFKSYAGLWFFQGGLLKDAHGYLMNAQEGVTKSLRQWRFQHIDEIPVALVKAYVEEALDLVKAGKKISADTTPKPLVLPVELATALEKDDVFRQQWNTFSLACQREFAVYIAEAKREDTRQKRLEKVTGMVAEKKGLNDNYKK